MRDLGHHTRQGDRPDHSNYNCLTPRSPVSSAPFAMLHTQWLAMLRKERIARLRKRVGAILRKHKAARLRKDGCAILCTCRSFIRNSKTTFSRWEKAIPILGKGGFSYKIASYERRYLLSEKPSQTAFRRDFQPLGPRYFNLYFSRSYRRKDDLL